MCTQKPVGSSGFRMNKHCRNRERVGPRGHMFLPLPIPFSLSLSPVSPVLPSASFHGRSAPKFVTSLPFMLDGSGGCVDPFRRSSYLSTFVTRSFVGSTLISRRFATARSPLFFSLEPPLPSSSLPDHSRKQSDDVINVFER